MIRRPSKALGALAATLLIGLPQARSQAPTDGSSDSDYTAEQSEAIDRFDEMVGRLQAMRWGPEVVEALSTLGATACQYNQEIGVRAFETAYSVVAGLDFDSDDRWSVHALSQLATAAPRCEPSFLDRPLTRNIPAPELRAKGLLNATWKSLETDPHEAARFAQGVADHVPTLRGAGDVLFVRGLRKLRLQLPAEADRLFRDSLSSVAATGTIRDLFTLGNYVLCAIPERTDIPEVVTTLPDGSSSAYLLSAVRPEIPNELVGQYVATAIEMLLTRGTPATHDAESIALALQLASWAKTNAPEQSSTLSSLLGTQTDSPGIRRQLTEYREIIERSALSQRLEEELESTVDEGRKSRARFELCMNRIAEGSFSQAEDLLDDLARLYRIRDSEAAPWP